MISISEGARARLAVVAEQTPYIPRAFGLVWNSCRGLTVGWLVLVAVQGMLPAIAVVLTKHLVDGLLVLIRSGGAWSDIRSFLVPALLMGLTILGQELARGVSRWVRTAQAQAAAQHVERLVHQKSVSLDLAFYDSSEYYDRLHRAMGEATSTPLELLNSFGVLMQRSITLLAIGALLVVYAWWLPLVLVASTLPGLYFALDYIFSEHEMRLKQTEDKRRCWYYNRLLTSADSAAEVRLFDIGNHYMSLYDGLRLVLRRERLNLIKHSVILELAASTFGLVLMVITLVWFCLQAIQGLYTVGELAMLYQAYKSGQGLLRTLLEGVGLVYRSMLFLSNLFEYLDLEPEVRSSTRPASFSGTIESGICIDNVSFRYPGSGRYALRNFNLTIRAGDIVAIVGENGAGKSTLAKLLCRFYDPQAGSITIDGVDIRNIPLSTLRSLFSILFQEPVHYHETVASNVSVSTGHVVRDNEAIRLASRRAGADSVIARLPHGFDTLLGRMFKGGTDLSVGEWQRISLARAYLRGAPVLILDEPTSSMDPWSETAWLGHLRELERRQTTLIISHRFSVTAHATVIHVLDNGRVVESGSHRELMERNGKYAAGWRAFSQGAG